METKKRVTEIVRKIRLLAEAIDKRNYELRGENLISSDDFENTQALYRKLKDYAFAINVEHSISLLDSISQDLQKVGEATKELGEARNHIKKVTNIVSVTLSVVTAIGMITTAVLAPGVGTSVAALESIENAISSIVEDE